MALFSTQYLFHLMQDLYKDFSFKRRTVRYVRLPNFPTHTTAYQSAGGFHREGMMPAASLFLTTHDLYRLRQLCEQQATKKRLVYFDIAAAQLDNPEPELAEFETWVSTEEATDRELTSNHLA
jgi:hypothetical protein